MLPSPANGSLVLQTRGTKADRPTHAAKNRKELHPRSSEARQENFCPLTRPIMEVALPDIYPTSPFLGPSPSIFGHGAMPFREIGVCL
jgi:hypothetical protein